MTRLSPLLAAALLAVATPAAAQQRDEPIRIRISDPERDLYRLAIPRAAGDPALGQLVADVASNDLGLVGLFRVLDPKGFLADLAAEGLGLQLQKWRDVGAQGVMKARVTGSGGSVSIDFRLYEVARGEQPVLQWQGHGGAQGARGLVHRWCNMVVKYYTGEDGPFGSRVAFAAAGTRGVRDIYVMDFDGHGAYRLTDTRSISTLPAYSPRGDRIAFTSFMRDNPDLYLVGAGGGRPKRLSKQPGLNTGAAFSPDGSQIALTLSRDGNPDIFVISAADGRILRRVTDDPAIDTSPSWSPDGGRIAFVSDRGGSPQVYVAAAGGGGARRITFQGSYNQTPKWSPRKDASVIAFTGRDERGRYDVFTIDAGSGEVTRLTQGPGSNSDPTWAPNGRLVMFSSTAGGLCVVTDQGLNRKCVYRAGGMSPSWGPAPR